MISAEDIGHAMYQRRCNLDAADPTLAETRWTIDPGTRAFWTAEAAYVLELVARTCIACHPAVDEVCDIPGQLTIEDIA
jgi:hypothetical protein